MAILIGGLGLFWALRDRGDERAEEEVASVEVRAEEGLARDARERVGGGHGEAGARERGEPTRFPSELRGAAGHQRLDSAKQTRHVGAEHSSRAGSVGAGRVPR